MAVKPSGSPLKFSDITLEFGNPTENKLGAYRLNGGETIGTLTSRPLDTDIPQSGTIKFSQFYSKKLNIVVNCTGMNDFQTTVNARAIYNSPSSIPGTSVRVVGGFKGKPGNTNGSKVYINTNTRIGSEKGKITNTAFRTGGWDSGTELILEIGSSTRIYGSGGDGGNGGTSTPGTGSNGTSALGIDYPTAIINRGYIQAGFGGGGGGSYAAANVTINAGKKNSYNEYNVSSGGGGGGGAGYPAGDRGTSGGQQGSRGSEGSAGTNGGLETKGTGGANGTWAGAGGDGGQPASTDATKGDDALASGGGHAGAAPGTTGYAIIFYNDMSGSSVTNLNAIYPSGRYAYNTNPT
jgi:hypothetical protein